jgi:ADP-heptose:LPS heptosyltransferase
MNRQPLYYINAHEKELQRLFWHQNRLNGKTVIGVQLHADESYRDYPHMKTLVKTLAERFSVLVFDGKPIEGYNFDNVIKIDSSSLREAFALASGCDFIIAPDSAFVHLAGALAIPCLALFGPIDGKLRTSDYPSVDYLDSSQHLGCVPCWRNESIPCKLTGMRQSACMMSIPVSDIVTRVNQKLRSNENSIKDYDISIHLNGMNINTSKKYTMKNKGYLNASFK